MQVAPMADTTTPTLDQLKKLWEQCVPTSFPPPLPPQHALASCPHPPLPPPHFCRGKEAESKAALNAVGGPSGLAKALNSGLQNGVASGTLEARRTQYGANKMPKKALESWWSLFLGSFQDEVLIILIIVAMISIILNSYSHRDDVPNLVSYQAQPPSPPLLPP